MTDSTKDSGSCDRLKKDFFECSCEQLARKLLGQRLVRILADGRRLSGRIVETEAYVGAEDKAAHSYKGKRTARNEAMFMQPGTAYVYHIYGTLTCVNVSSQGEGHAVLIRALEPEEGLPQMKKHRGVKRADGGEGLKLTDLASGPSKLTQALSINRAEFDKEDLVSCKRLWLEEGSLGADEQVVSTARVGIEKAEEWASKPLRFYLKGCNSVSVIDKKAEAELQYEVRLLLVQP
ncbi:hypothetical protein CAPTEDRAFT_104419 [Capitella teleta]|uniref:DNA-3-methyladenine glycosylase n=1 Tax=Capitella teleta TaxID=283909 RepID=R7V9V5_CAPTE|nr:hypothetical protein CAPTEDRAFT_104419 [Capitella teleta]|eukprot:ELU15282.1 hypothetical protein CAPTEDRAFT_104419 [Capitella teleta]